MSRAAWLKVRLGDVVCYTGLPGGCRVAAGLPGAAGLSGAAGFARCCLDGFDGLLPGCCQVAAGSGCRVGVAGAN